MRAIVAVLLMSLCTLVQAQTYPAKPIRIVVPFAPGGASDVLARQIGQKMSESMGQQVIVENKPGAGGNIGADAVAKSPADGYTLLLAAAGFMAVNPSVYAKLPYDSVKDFQPITLLVKSPLLLVVNPQLPASNAKALIDYAKAHPGKLTIGNGGTGTAQHLGGEYFTSVAAINAVHVPYKGSAPATVDLLAGVVDAQLDNIVGLLPHVKSGKLRAIAVSSLKRQPILPDVPTIAEAALPGFETGTWYGIVAPANLPTAIRDRLHHEIVRIVNSPDVQEKLLAQGFEPSGNTPEEFGAMIKSEIEKYAKVVKAAGITAQ